VPARTSPSIVDLNDLLTALPGCSNDTRRWWIAQTVLLEQLNPLERLVVLATIVDQIWVATLRKDPSVLDLGGVLVPIRGQEAVRYLHQRAVAVSAEDGGVLGASIALRKDPDCLPIFSNDCGYTRFGIDVVAQNRRTARFLICEAKGTINPIRSPGIYLKETRHKGRQLSWYWCWMSLCEFALHGPTARIFLLLFRDVLRGKAERCLAITRLLQRGRNWLVDETRIVREEDLQASGWLAEKPSWSRESQWLSELDSEEGQGRQDELRSLVEVLSRSWARAIEGPARKKG
jgi:hypothetical protein